MMLKPQARHIAHEELANSVSHIVGLAAAGAALVVWHPLSDHAWDSRALFGVYLYTLSLVALYLFSAASHGCPPGGFKQILTRLDESAIFIFVAGTYSAFSLGSPQQPDWLALGFIWCIAVAGATLKVAGKLSDRRVAVVCYLLLGWSAFFAVRPLLRDASHETMVWLAAGCVCYTIGVHFYVRSARTRFNHLIWHLFVMGGTGCHLASILCYLASGSAAWQALTAQH
jgi:hemolysin III